MISFSEIETTTKRASKAAGFSWGVAEEIGKSIRSLELFGLPGIINLNQYLKKIKKKHPKKITKIEKENKTDDKELCPIYSGVAFLDRCLELEKLKSLKFYNVSYPLLMLPFISRASEIMSKKILVQFTLTKSVKLRGYLYIPNQWDKFLEGSYYHQKSKNEVRVANAIWDLKDILQEFDVGSKMNFEFSFNPNTVNIF